jgi:TetR/AcrR family transcriptional regulator, regulator of autoinduction and epiphytic fitness
MAKARSVASSPIPPRRPPRVDPRVAQTKRLVKETTLDLIAEVGFEGTNIELIAERSGVSRTTIYRHWPDPAQLYLEAFDPPSDDVALPSLTGRTLEDLRTYLQHVADRLNDDRFAAALAAQIDKSQRDAAYRAAHFQYASERNASGVRIFRDGIADGTFARTIDPEHETELVLSYLVYARVVHHRHLDQAEVDRLYREVVARCTPTG